MAKCTKTAHTSSSHVLDGRWRAQVRRLLPSQRTDTSLLTARCAALRCAALRCSLLFALSFLLCTRASEPAVLGHYRVGSVDGLRKRNGQSITTDEQKAEGAEICRLSELWRTNELVLSSPTAARGSKDHLVWPADRRTPKRWREEHFRQFYTRFLQFFWGAMFSSFCGEWRFVCQENPMVWAFFPTNSEWFSSMKSNACEWHTFFDEL